ncbi:STAS domain-containing protein [Bacillus solitudinis]|uniref:STAS domain-containing protein n=1 Tax=Bacillus solitudinis TaxID=2014074 RepID=UPI000C24B27E|nr:STAS domain-containing protein [Bacillus solitudinis]
MTLTVEVIKSEIEVTLKLKGVLDISTTNLIDPYLEEIDEKIISLNIDFGGLEFIDSTGIGSIMNAIHLSQEKNFKLRLQGIDEITHQVFELVGLYTVLEAIQGEVV